MPDVGTVHHGDCLDVMRTMAADSVHAIVTDPPYGLGFMGKEWDDLPPGVEWAAECLRVLVPGGYLLAFGGTRTFHRLACAVEDGGFEVRDSIAWLYGSGFPKSRNVGREVTGFEGWGTALKPAFEPIVVARRPLQGTVAANVLAHGTGALNIDACRVDGKPRTTHRDGNKRLSNHGATLDERLPVGDYPGADGRWPANVMLDGSQADALDQQSGVTKSGGRAWTAGDTDTTAWRELEGREGPATRGDYARKGDSGGASRYFPTFRYQAKAPTAERPSYVKDGAADHRAGGNFAGGIRVCNVCQNRTKPGNYVGGDDRPWPACGHDDWEWGTPKEQGGKIAHPTVKPLGLMRWLVRLVTPPGGTVLDPFAGSGATVEACLIEGFDCIAIEREADYLPLIAQRIDRQAGTLPLDRPA
jgi:DNA modification methylase